MGERELKELYSESRKKAFLFRVLGGLLLIVASLLYFRFGTSHLFGYFFSSKPDLKDTSIYQLSEDKWYKYDINSLYGYYSYRSDGSLYIASVKDGEFFSIYVDEDDKSTAEQISQNTFDYLKGTKSAPSDKHLTGKGYLVKLSPSQKNNIKTYLGLDDETEETKDIKIADYYVYSPSLFDMIFSDTGNNHLFFFLFALFFFCFGTYGVISFICGAHKRKFKKALARYGILEEAFEKDMENATRIDNAFIGNEHVVIYDSMNIDIVPYDALIWAYYHVTETQHTTYGVKTKTTRSYQVIMWDHNKRKITTNVKNESNAIMIIAEMHNRAPYFYNGYSKELAAATDGGRFNEMVSAVYESRNNYLNRRNSYDQEVF